MDRRHKRYIPVIIVLGIFLILTVALLGQYGWMLNLSSDVDLDILDSDSFAEKDMETDGQDGTECLYLWDSTDENSVVFHNEMPQILHDMKVAYTEVDLSKEELPDLEPFEIVITGFTNYQDNRDVILAVTDWMEAGGSLFIPQVPENGSAYEFMSSRIGVANMGTVYYRVEGIRITDDFILKGNTDDYSIAFPFESALPVELDDECEVHMVTADEREVPVLWETDAKKGHVVVVNLGHYEKSLRGIYSSAYSLLSEYCIWPVINSSAFYLDGFPFPLSQEKNRYITDVYGENMDLYSFYVREWWNDLMSLSGRYDVKYTASLLENNDNDVDPPYEEKGSTNRYQYFISVLLELEGELGLYGYNQQPLVLRSSALRTDEEEELPDYEDDLGLNFWNSTSDMEGALKETVRFQKSLTDETVMQVYVPPSDILSEEGLDAVKNSVTDIRSVAGTYIDGGYAQGQEYEVDEDGMIMTPRITSGCLFDDEMKLRALSELNFHYITSHSMSPSDVINPDAGADEGWPALYESLEVYEEWIDSAAPDIRKQTGSETAGAVQRFYYADAEEEETDAGLEIHINNFQDEAWFMIRLNEWKPDLEKTEGGELERLTGDLYLLRADSEDVTVIREESR